VFPIIIVVAAIFLFKLKDLTRAGRQECSRVPLQGGHPALQAALARRDLGLYALSLMARRSMHCV
jgi:hypothetical protein